MKIEQYTESQVLCGLQEVWKYSAGVYDLLDPDTQIDAFMKDNGTWDDETLDVIVYRIQRFFGFTCSSEEWMDFFGLPIARNSLEEWERTIAPSLTFGALARFVAERAPVVASFDPICMLGRQCAPAGVFTGIQQLADHTTGKHQFAPSSRIIDVLRGRHLNNFWTKLRWMTEDSIPSLPLFWREVTGQAGCLGVLATVAGSIGTWATSDPIWIVAALLGTIVRCLFAFAYRYFKNPLPSDIVTFRDLAACIARNRDVMLSKTY